MSGETPINRLDQMADQAARRMHPELGCDYAFEDKENEASRKWLTGMAKLGVEPLFELIDKLTWQVRDTCARAEKAEAALIKARAQGDAR